MCNRGELSPAESQALAAFQEVRDCIKSGISFKLEAGAGSGKTYSLLRSLDILIEEKGRSLMRTGKRIACITYTNVARDEISIRTQKHSAITPETIHSFCWRAIEGFQEELKGHLPNLNDKWEQRIVEANGVGDRRITYDLGYPGVTDFEVSLHHDDVPTLMVKLLENVKFRQLFSKQYPYVFIDEYQDTHKGFADALIKHFVENPEHGVVIGFFGDSWQKIYGTESSGKINCTKLLTISKHANFRSDRKIVEFLNRLRPDLKQAEKDSNSYGSVHVYHTNNWNGARRTEGHWKGDLPPEIVREYRDKARADLVSKGWLFDPVSSKTLMLTHNLLAEELKYKDLLTAFSRNRDKLLRKEDPFISYLIDTFEPACRAYLNGNIGLMFSLLGTKIPKIRHHSDKVLWKKSMDRVLHLRTDGTIGQLLEHLTTMKLPRLPERLEQRFRKNQDTSKLTNRTEEETKDFEKNRQFFDVNYTQVMAASDFINGMTPFETKHGVKGAQFDEVFVDCGRGWNHYNFSQMLDWMNSGVPAQKRGTFERSRNLFYVACSRPKHRLAILFTQELSRNALNQLEFLVGRENVIAL